MRRLPLQIRQRVLFIVLSFLFVIALGVVGYMVISHYPFLDALYMTVITLSTVGYSETRPLDNDGRIFTIVLLIFGLSMAAFHTAWLGQLVLERNFLESYRRHRVKRKLQRMKKHYVVCGFGQMGKLIVQELVQHRIPVVVIEQDDAVLVELQELGVPFWAGDAKEEEALEAVGIRQAEGLVAVVGKDTDNVFVVLTARDLNRDLFICARAGSKGIEKRLLRAGANRVVSPYAAGATRLAHHILRPTVTDFLELALSGGGMGLSLEELHIPEDADVVGKDLVSSGIRSNYNLIVVAIKKRDEGIIYNPSSKAVIHAGDTLIVIGPKDRLDEFATLLYGTMFYHRLSHKGPVGEKGGG